MKPEDIATEYFKYLQRAELLMDVGRWREAQHELRQHLAAYPDSYECYCQSAICHLQLKEYQQAYELTKKAVEIDPECEWAFRLQSMIFSENGETSRALDSAKICVEKAPYLSTSIACLFWAQVNYGSLDDAEEYINALMEMAPDSTETHEAAGYLSLKRKNDLEAEKHYLEALRLDPESVNAMNNLGVVYLNLAQSGKGHHYHDKSVEMFERAVRQQPTFTMGQENISVASNAFKIGAPVGVGLFLWFGLQLFGRWFSWMADDKASPFALSPITSSYLLTFANLLFLLLMVVATAYFAGLYARRFKSFLRYQIVMGYFWPIGFVLFGSLSTIYIVSLWRPVNGSLGISLIGFAISMVLTFITGLNSLIVWGKRRAAKSND